MNNHKLILEVDVNGSDYLHYLLSEVNTLLHRGCESYNKLKGHKLNIYNVSARFPSDMEEAIQNLVETVKQETQKNIKESL